MVKLQVIRTTKRKPQLEPFTLASFATRIISRAELIDQLAARILEEFDATSTVGFISMQLAAKSKYSGKNA